MEKAKKLNLIGQLLLLAATIVWGTSFFILKETIEQVPTFYVIAIRFIVAGLGLWLIFLKRLKNIDKNSIKKGAFLGLCLAGAYIAQTIGLKHTTPGRNAFLTSSYCVMCPFLMWMLFKKKPKLYNLISAITCVVGIGLIALSGSSSNGENTFLGDGLTLVGAVFFGLQIVFIDKFQKGGYDSIKLLVPEILTAGGVFLAISLCLELPFDGIGAYALNTKQMINILYLTLACTLFAQSAQIIGQKYTTANQSAIILSLESVFGTFFSVIFANERLTVGLVIGFAVVFVAILITELKLDPIDLFKRQREKK